MTLTPNHIQEDVTRVGVEGEAVIIITHTPTDISVMGEVDPNGKFKNETELRFHLIKKLTEDVLNFKAKEWHDSESKVPFHEYLGLSYEQFSKWVEERDDDESANSHVVYE